MSLRRPLYTANAFVAEAEGKRVDEKLLSRMEREPSIHSNSILEDGNSNNNNNNPNADGDNPRLKKGKLTVLGNPGKGVNKTFKLLSSNMVGLSAHRLF